MQPDRFTLKTQQAVQAAISLAHQRRNPQATPEHLLLALLDQEDGVVAPVLAKLGVDAGAASELVQVLHAAEDEMRALKDEYVSTEHVLLALAGHRSPAGDALREAGATKASLEQAVAEVRGPHRVTDPEAEDKYRALEKFGRDLTQAAADGKLDPVIGRDDEIRRVVQVLSRRTKNNPVLIGEPGVGK